MASIISYFGSLAYPSEKDKELLVNLPGYDSWVGSRVFSENLGQFTKPDQLRFYVDQALALAYFRAFFGGRCHEAVNEYAALVVTNATAFMSRSKTDLNYGSYPRVFETLENVLRYVKNGAKWVDVPIGLILELINADSPAMAAMPKFFGTREKIGTMISFLMWMNELPQEGFISLQDRPCGIIIPYLTSAFWGRPCGSIWDSTVRSDFFSIGTSFSKVEDTTRCRFRGVAILDYLLNFDLSNFRLEALIALLSQFAFHTDVNRSGLSMTHLLAIAMRYGVTREVSFSGDTPMLENDGAHMRSSLFEVAAAFVSWFVETWKVENVDKEILYRTFFTLATSKEQKSAASYLKQADAAPSSEAWEAFKTILPGCESLQLISQNPTVVDAALDDTVVLKDDSTGEGSGDNPETPEPEQGNDGAGSEGEQKEEGNEGTDEPEDPTEDLDEQTEETEDDPAEPEQGNDESSENTDEDNGSSGEGETDNTTTIHNESSQPELNLSDKRGIILEWTKPEDETINTALFREEINTLISDIMANPPKTISAQNLATLVALKRYWLYTLRVESIVGILESCIRIPLTTKKLKSIGVS